jgi:hypothetical protein
MGGSLFDLSEGYTPDATVPKRNLGRAMRSAIPCPPKRRFRGAGA